MSTQQLPDFLQENILQLNNILLVIFLGAVLYMLISYVENERAGVDEINKMILENREKCLKKTLVAEQKKLRDLVKKMDDTLNNNENEKLRLGTQQTTRTMTSGELKGHTTNKMSDYMDQRRSAARPANFYSMGYGGKAI